MNIEHRAFVLLQQHNQLLLLRDAQHPSHLKLPGGHVEQGESFLQAALREVEEEVAIELAASALTPLHLVEFSWEGKQYTSMLFLATAWEGNPVNVLPGEHSELLWVDATNLPTAGLFPPTRQAMVLGLQGTFYSEWRKDRGNG
ncbi:NUDIX hydrolase [bacterium]|nr:NUDIX hydrolase [bacterium]